jgi:hypothetical protein
MALTIIENFNALTNGDLNGQNGWSAYSSFDVQDSVKQEGAKALYVAHDGTNRVAPKSLPNYTSGIYGCYIRAVNHTGVNAVSFYDSNGTTYITNFRTHPNGKMYISDKAWTDIVTVDSYTNGVWYHFESELDQPNGRIRGRIDGAAWSEWSSTSSFTNISKITIDVCDDPGAAGYWDYVTYDDQLATVTTQAVTDRAATTGTGNGTITDIGGANATRRGFCYKIGSSGDPTTADSVAYDDGDFGATAYTKAITGLTSDTIYQVRAYAVNSAGTAYGTTVSYTTASGPAGLKTFNGLAVGSVKTIKGLAIGSVKNWN